MLLHNIQYTKFALEHRVALMKKNKIWVYVPTGGNNKITKFPEISQQYLAALRSIFPE